MAKSVQSRSISTELSLEQFRQFVLPHLTVGRRGPVPKLSLYALFNYILKLLYLGCQWNELPIAKDAEGRLEIHYTRIYGAIRRWQAGGCFDIIFTVVVLRLHQFRRLLLRSERLSQLHYAFKTFAYTMINLRHCCWRKPGIRC
jgi:transposase